MTLIEQLYEEFKTMEGHQRVKQDVGPRVMGPSGLFGVAGLERDVISTRVAPRGIADKIPVRPSNTMFPMFPYLMGFTAPEGDMPDYDEECPDGPVAGAPKSCMQTAQFGRFVYKTRELNITTLGEYINRGDFRDLRFVKDPLADELATVFPNLDRSAAAFFGSEVLARFIAVGVAFQNRIVRDLWVGDGTGPRMVGLETLVSLTHYDAVTGTLCEALRSDIRDFGDVDITTAEGAASIVAQIVDVVRNARYKADRMNFGATTWALVMKHHLFQELADIWPCAYMTSRCEMNNENGMIAVLGSENVNLRRQMRAGMYLLVDDVPVTVITDDGMPEDELGDLTFASDIYLLPLTVLGGRPVLYWQYFDYREGTIPAIRDGRLEDIFWTDGGRYLWTRQSIHNGCVQWQAEAKLRIILETPQLAARIMNVVYTVNKHYRTHDPEYTSYFVNGGNVEGLATPMLYNHWNNIPD